MSYFNMSKRLYRDRKAPDGVIATGWRKVKRGGKVKFGGTYYVSERLADLVGELVFVGMADYWQQEVTVSRGAIDCREWFCDAAAER